VMLGKAVLVVVALMVLAWIIGGFLRLRNR
jgi:hypothetical protein